VNKNRIAAVAGFCMIGAAAFAFVDGKILNPQMKPEKGTYESPAAQLGEKSAQPWSTTTIEAAVNGKPLLGKTVTLVGEVVDYSCYLQVGKHGGTHRSCGQKCIQSGMPAGLLTRDGKLYLLMAEEHHPRRDGLTTLRESAIENMGYIVEVTGTMTEVDKQKALFVDGFVKK
jgi:hypothetical protein